MTPVWAQSNTSPAEAEPTKSVLVMDLKYGQGITKDNAFVMTQELATELARDNAVRVQTVEDTRVTLGVEAQKQMAGCDQNSCLAEIAQAMGTEMLLFGRIDRIGSQVTLQLTLLESSTAKALIRSSAKGKDVASLLLRIDEVLVDVKPALNPDFGPSPMLIGGVAGVGVGAVALLVGGIVGAIAFTQMTDLQFDAPSRESIRARFFWPAVSVAAVGVVVIAGAGAIAAVGMTE